MTGIQIFDFRFESQMFFPFALANIAYM